MKYVSLSTDAHPHYAIYAPMVCRIWRRLGWNPILAVHPEHWDTPLGQFVLAELVALGVRQYPALTYAPLSTGNTMRVVRLCAMIFPEIADNDIVMTSDVDVCPLSREFFTIDDSPENRTWDIFDLRADFQGFLQEKLRVAHFRFAMCYVGMRAGLWRDVLNFHGCTLDIKSAMDRLQFYRAEQALIVQENGGTIHPLTGDSTDMDELWMTAHILSTPGVVDGPCVRVPEVSWCGFPVHQQGRMRLVATRLPGGYPDRMMLLGEWRVVRNDKWDLKTTIDWHMPRPATSWLGNVIARFWPEEAEWLASYWAQASLLAKLGGVV